MNSRLTNSIRHALVNQVTPTEHPSADQLTAFVEHNLQPAERSRVTDHLAKCSDCRELVFLSSDLAEDPVVAKAEPVRSFAAVRKQTQAVRTNIFGATGLRWGVLAAWGVPVTAALVVGVLLLEHQPGHVQRVAQSTESESSGAQPSQIASSRPPNETIPQQHETPNSRDQQSGSTTMSHVEGSEIQAHGPANPGLDNLPGHAFGVRLRYLKGAENILGETPRGTFEGELKVLPRGGVVFHCRKPPASTVQCMADIVLQREEIKSVRAAGHDLVLFTDTATYAFAAPNETIASIADEIKAAK